MEKLLSLRFDVEDYPFWDKPDDRYTKQLVSWYDDRLIDAVEDSSGGRAGWLIRAGNWALHWLNPKSRLYMANIDFRCCGWTDIANETCRQRWRSESDKG